MVPQPVSELVIAGKKVQVRTSFKGREWMALPALYRRAWTGARDGKYAECVPFLARVIEDWEFQGKPAEESSYDALEVIGELVPLADATLMAVAEAAFPPPIAG